MAQRPVWFGAVKLDRWLLVIWFTAVVLRLLPVVLTAHVGIGLDDMLQYNELARNILAGKGYVWYGDIPTAFRPPLYPLFLAAIYFFAGPNVIAARVVQALLGSLLPVLVYVLAGRIFGDIRLARIAGWLVALYPTFWIYPLGLVTENLYVPLLALFVVLFVGSLARDRGAATAPHARADALATADPATPNAPGGRPWGYLLPGAILGLVILTRSVITLFAPFAALWIWMYSPGSRKVRLQRVAIFLLPIVLLTAPWSLRNSLLYGEPVFVESSLGLNLYIGYHPQSDGTFSAPITAEILDEVHARERMDLAAEKDVDRLGTEQAFAFIRADPARVPYLIVSKISYLLRFDVRGAMYFYTNDFLGPLPAPVIVLVATLLIVPAALLLLLAAAGMASAGWGPATRFVGLLIVYYVGIHALILAEPRFLLPMVPLLCVFAARGLVSLRQTFASRRHVLLVAGPWLLLFLNWGYEFWQEADKWRIILSPGGNLAGFDY